MRMIVLVVAVVCVVMGLTRFARCSFWADSDLVAAQRIVQESIDRQTRAKVADAESLAPSPTRTGPRTRYRIRARPQPH